MDQPLPHPLPAVESLEGRPLAELRVLYAEIVGRPPPSRARAAFLIGNLAWAIQARAQNEDPTALREALLEAAARPARPDETLYKPGTRLIREWQGQVHEVTILQQGYQWQGRVYKSLTSIAWAITGAHWSGPRFFGLRSQRQ